MSILQAGMLKERERIVCNVTDSWAQVHGLILEFICVTDTDTRSPCLLFECAELSEMFYLDPRVCRDGEFIRYDDLSDKEKFVWKMKGEIK